MVLVKRVDFHGAFPPGRGELHPQGAGSQLTGNLRATPGTTLAAREAWSILNPEKERAVIVQVKPDRDAGFAGLVAIDPHWKGRVPPGVDERDLLDDLFGFGPRPRLGEPARVLRGELGDREPFVTSERRSVVEFGLKMVCLPKTKPQERDAHQKQGWLDP